MANWLYNSPECEGNPSGNRSEGKKHIYTHMFLKYFDHVATREFFTKSTRIARQRHESFNRYLVGHPQFLNTIAPRERISGTGEVAGEVTLYEMSASNSAASSSVGNPQMTTPRRRRAINYGRSGRTSRLNVEFGTSPGTSIPPSTCSFRSINVERMKEDTNLLPLPYQI